MHFGIRSIRWDSRRQKLEFSLYECLKPSEFVSLELDSSTYTNPDTTIMGYMDDDDCESNRTTNQFFEFDETSKPLENREYVAVRLTLRSGGSSPPTHTPTPTATATPTATTVPGATATSTPTATATPTIAEDMDTAIAMIGELHSAVLINGVYTGAEANLSTCLNGASDGVFGAAVTPFNDILGNYNTHKSKIEPGGVCGMQGTAMFAAIKSVSEDELAILKRDNPAYAALLNTSHGRAFERDVGNADVIKLYATLASPQVSGEASSGDGVSGAAPVKPTPVPTPRTGVSGVECLAVGNSVEHSPAWRKIEILNCLVFDTPRSFWVTQSGKTTSTNDLASATDMRYRFLGYGDWKCTFVSDLPIPLDHPFLPSCVKHDVAYASLQKFSGEGDSPDELDSAWNPRNKYLADYEFLYDLLEDAENWGVITQARCLSSYRLSFAFGIACQIALTQEVTLKRAYAVHWGVATINSKWWVEGWSLTDADKTDALRNYHFVEVNNTP